jgi:hypothetical protein
MNESFEVKSQNHIATDGQDFKDFRDDTQNPLNSRMNPLLQLREDRIAATTSNT